MVFASHHWPTGAADSDGLAAVGASVEGDPTFLGRLQGSLAAPDPDFAVVTP